MASIYDLSWSKTSFFAKLALFFKSINKDNNKINSNVSAMRAEGYSALSSTYYSIAGTSFSQLRAIWKPSWLVLLAPLRVLWWSISWLPLGAWCYFRMLHFSNKVAKLVGYQSMSAEQCDVRQSILRARRKYEEAKHCIQHALIKPTRAHTRGLLHASLADVYLKLETDWQDEAEIEVQSALLEVAETEKYDPRQAARIYRQCADLTDQIRSTAEPGMVMRRRAEKLARDADAQDQLLKI